MGGRAKVEEMNVKFKTTKRHRSLFKGKIEQADQEYQKMTNVDVSLVDCFLGRKILF